MSAAASGGLAVHGACGRMGAAVLGEARRLGLAIAGAIEREGHPHLGSDVGTLAGEGETGVVVTADVAAAVAQADAVIDFGASTAIETLVAQCVAHRLPLVSGTTGLSKEQQDAIGRASASIAIVQAPNMSVGVTVLNHLVREAGRLLGGDFDIEIVEMHHRKKIDAPSGTAKRLFHSACESRGLDPDKVGIYGREGQVGARSDEEVGVMTLRGGSVVGDHSVIFAGEGERVELSHKAETRSIFAAGAVRAALWCTNQPPGLYTMEDVLALRS